MSLKGLFSAPRFDWYEVTFTENYPPEELLGSALRRWDFADVVQARPKLRQYQHAAEIRRGDQRIIHLCWGGCNVGVHLLSSGQFAHDVYQWLREIFSGGYAVSRADVCLDTVEPGMFDYLTRCQVRFANDCRITQDQAGDWLKEGSPAGRTLYLGSMKAGSKALTRTYEKGKQLNQDPNWVRFEVEVRPQSAKSKELLSEMNPFAVMMSVKWVQRLVLEMLHDHGLDLRMFQTISTSWSASDEQRAYMALIRQYGKRLKHDAENLPGGWPDVGLKLQAFVELLEENKRAMGGIGDNPYEEVLSRILAGNG